MATIEIPDYLLDFAGITSDELNAELVMLTPREAAERLQEISKSAEEFLVYVISELRTPVTAMVGYTDLLVLKNHSFSTDEKKRFISAIRESAQSLSREMSAIADMVLQRAGSLKLNSEAVNLNEFIEQVVFIVAENIDYRYEHEWVKEHNQILKPELECSIPGELPNIRIDGWRFQRILVETLLQAVRIYDRKSESKIVFNVSYSADWVNIEVIDDGVGMPSHLNGQLPNLFPTNKHIIEMHGGKMKVESCENAGWVVNFKLPIDQENLSK